MEIRHVKDWDKVSDEVKNAQAKLDELLAPKEHSEEYNAMMAEHRRNLNKINRDANHCPWEWSWGLDYLVEFLRFMQAYYKLGENVFAKEDCEWRKDVKYTRYESLTKTLEYYDKWQNLDDEYVQVIHHPETYEERDNGDGTYTVIDHGYHCVYKYKTARKTYKKLHKAQKKYKKLFFESLNEYIESWWDQVYNKYRRCVNENRYIH